MSDSVLVLCAEFGSYKNRETGEVRGYGRIRTYVTHDAKPEILEFQCDPLAAADFSTLPGVYQLETYTHMQRAVVYDKPRVIPEVRVRSARLVSGVSFEPVAKPK